MPRKPRIVDSETLGDVDPDDDAGALRKMGGFAAAFEAAADDEEKTQEAVAGFFGFMEELPNEVQKRLFAHPTVRKFFEVVEDKDTTAPASPTDPPGTIYYRTVAGERIPWSKKPWTWGWLYNPPPPYKPAELKTWIPSKTINLHFNGLPATVFANEEITLPAIFHGLFLEHLRAEKLAAQHAAWLMKKSDKLDDPSIVTRDGAMSRAIANHDGRGNIYGPGMGPAGLFERAPGDIDGDAA